jgi:hypothetical protein
MSFLLMVPEAASPSGPPSSRMSRTSAPVAITPERWGNTQWSKFSAWRSTRLKSRGGSTPDPSGGRVKSGPQGEWSKSGQSSACVLPLQRS